GPLPDPGRPPERARPEALDRWPFVDERLEHPQLLRKELVVVLRVRDRRFEDLLNRLRRRTRRVSEYCTRLIDRLSTDMVDHEPRLAGRAAYVFRLGAHVDRRRIRLRPARRPLLGAGLGGAAARRRAFGFWLLAFGVGLGVFGFLGGLVSLGLLGLLGLRSLLRLW